MSLPRALCVPTALSWMFSCIRMAYPSPAAWTKTEFDFLTNPPPKAGSHRDLYAPKSIFSRNTAKKIHGRRQPCRGFFHCLAEKSFSLECFAVLNIRFFLAAIPLSAEILCVFQDQRRKLRGKRFIQNRVNPYARPPNAGDLFFAEEEFHKKACI